MTTWIIVPVKPAAASKTRLRGVLGDDERIALSRRMLAHVVAVAGRAPGVDALRLVGPAPRDHAGLARIDDPGRGLNPALTVAAEAARAAGADRLLVIAADLPLLADDDIAALLGVGERTVGIAPDRAGTGTNALSLPLTEATHFAFRYGEGSFARHAAEADRLGLAWQAIRTPTLALDIDLPDDLAALAAAEESDR